jgi:ferritin-like metal-binding protein YciE
MEGHVMLLDNLSDFFQRGLEYAWDCEELLVKQLPLMVEAARSQDLKHALDLHVVETKAHLYQLEQIFQRLERSPAAEKNEPVRILASECEKVIGHLDPSSLRDAALIFYARQIEQSEIGLYESLSGFARALNLAPIASLIDEILAEEKNAARQLALIAEGSVNRAATSVHNDPPFALI